jgi:hypothetical protein
MGFLLQGTSREMQKRTELSCAVTDPKALQPADFETLKLHKDLIGHWRPILLEDSPFKVGVLQLSYRNANVK